MAPVEDRVLRKILPGAQEEARLRTAVRAALDAVAAECAKRGLSAEPILVGSVAKGTHLTNTEIDIFVAFPPETPRAELEKYGLALGSVLERPVRMYAEHPYTRGWFRGFEMEIVPCYKITDATQRMSAVDRTPLHADYVIGHLREGQADEVRLLKAWTKGVGVYGAEAKVRGFSGYLCELLVLKSGTFRAVLEGALGWRPGTALELDVRAERTFPEPLVVVDPVDPARNVASAVSVEQMATFVHAAREYLRRPTERFFFPREPAARSAADLRRTLRSRGTKLLAVAFPLPDLTEDVVYPQLRKAQRAMGDLFARHGFAVLGSRFAQSGRTAVFLFEFEVFDLPAVATHEGPPAFVRNALDFLGKWARSPRRVSGPFLRGDRWVVLIRREAADAAKLLRAKLRGLSLGKDLDRAKARAKIIEDGAAIRAPFAAEVSALWDVRFPWER